jgi:hypothetical protein
LFLAESNQSPIPELWTFWSFGPELLLFAGPLRLPFFFDATREGSALSAFGSAASRRAASLGLSSCGVEATAGTASRDGAGPEDGGTAEKGGGITGGATGGAVATGGADDETAGAAARDADALLKGASL